MTENTESLPTLMGILGDCQVVDALCAEDRYNVPSDVIRQYVREAHDELKRLRSSHQLAGVKALRHKMLAHTARDWEKSQSAHQNRHTIELVEMTAPTIEKLNVALRGQNSSYDELVQQEQRYAERFWRRAASLN